MTDALPLDVSARLSQDFGERADVVGALLLAHRRVGSGDYLCERLVRCIVGAARGDEQRLQQLIDAARLDYRDVIVAAVDARPASKPPFDYTADHWEGRATFVGPKGELEIEKKDRQWTIHGNALELEVHGLDHPFGDEGKFSDTVSGYLLSNIVLRAATGADEAQPAPAPHRPWWRFWK